MTTALREPSVSDAGPFDLIGDIHGCARELGELLDTLGYHETHAAGRATRSHASGRRAIFLGDIIDRGPGVVQALETVMNMVASGSALCVTGNHEHKLLRKFSDDSLYVGRGLAATLEQIDAVPEPEGTRFRTELQNFLAALPFHYVLDGGKLVVAHAGLVEKYHGIDDEESRTFAMKGSRRPAAQPGRRTPPEPKVPAVLPSRAAWVLEYSGDACVVYGHTPVRSAAWRNNTICIDTGCVYGGALTALRYPERELVSIQAHEVYFGSPDEIWSTTA